MTQLHAFLLTLLIEVPLAQLIARSGFARDVARASAPAWRGGKPRATVVLLLAVLASSVTHPIVWWLNGDSWARLIALELGAAIVESAIYFAGLRNVTLALVLGFVTNAVSFGVGLVIYAWMQ